MGSVNKATLIGNLGKDAELKYTQSGKAVANFSMATTEKWTDGEGQKKENTQWHRVILWGKVAESLHQYLTKGKQIYVEGRIEQREYEKDGQKQRITEIIADKIVLLGGGARDDDSRSSGASGRQAAPATAAASVNDDDIPF